MKELLARLDHWAERMAAVEWAQMEPRRRRRWAVLLTVECLVLSALGGWAFSVAMDDSMAWVFFGLGAMCFTAFFWGLALNPKAAFKYGVPLIMGCLSVAPFVLAYLTRS